MAIELSLAELLFEEGQLTEATRLAGEALTSVSELVVPSVHLLRARIFLARGDLDEAHAALQDVGEPVSLQPRLRLRIQRARLDSARGGPSKRKAASRSLRAVLAEAQRLGWLEGQFEARLALAELELDSGMKASGLARLKTLERDARKSGWMRWAHNAATLHVGGSRTDQPVTR